MLFRSVGRRRARRRLIFIFSRFRTTPTVGSLCRFFCGLFFFAFCVGKTAVAAGRGWPVGRLVSGQAERALLRCRKKNKGKQNNQLVHNQRVSDGELYGSTTCVLFFRPFHPIARRQTGVDEDVGAAALVAPTLAKSTLGAGFFFNTDDFRIVNFVVQRPCSSAELTNST